MNTNANPAEASASSSRDNPCYGNDPTVAALNVFTDDEHSYQLPYAQFLYAEMTPNPALEKNADAPPEKLRPIPAPISVQLPSRSGRGDAPLTKVRPRNPTVIITLPEIDTTR